MLSFDKSAGATLDRILVQWCRNRVLCRATFAGESETKDVFLIRTDEDWSGVVWVKDADKELREVGDEYPIDLYNSGYGQHVVDKELREVGDEYPIDLYNSGHGQHVVDLMFY
jgi:hypothetical protein